MADKRHATSLQRAPALASCGGRVAMTLCHRSFWALGKTPIFINTLLPGKELWSLLEMLAPFRRFKRKTKT